MTDNFFCLMFGLLAAAILFAGTARAETFEFLTYTPPGGWVNQPREDGIAYRRLNGIGVIVFYASQPASQSPADEFSRMWRARVEPTLPGAAPKPQFERDGDYTAAVGQSTVNAQGTMTTVALVTFVGRGRAIGVLTMSAGDDVLREITAFLDSIKVDPDAPATPNSGSTLSGAAEVDFDVPPGYTAKREGGMVLLTPTAINETTPCVYGISPSRPSKGSLEADAHAAVLEALPGWQIKDEGFSAMRGTAGAGWKYFWFRAMVQGLIGGSYQPAYAMATAFSSAQQGRVNIVWGFGPVANPHCQLDDLAFVRLFHSLRPRGWTSDGGKALAQEIQGTWQNSQSAGIARYKFMNNGRYESGIGTVTTTGISQRTSSSVADGIYTLSGDVLTVTPDQRGRAASRYRVRVYDNYFSGRWWRQMSLVDEQASPALNVLYDRIEN
jgi:hypothetical protein